MKKILFILAFVYTVFSYGQGGPKVDAIKFKGDVTTTVRDAIDVPVGETWLIWNTTSEQFEYSESDDIWYPLPGKVDNIKFKNNVTTSVRNTIDVPVGETWLIWNTTTGQFEYSESDDTWYDLQGITDGSNSTTFFQISTQALNKIEIGVDGPVGSTDYVRLSGGEETGDPTILYLTNDYAALSGISNADIDAAGDGAIITKGYADDNYGSGGVTDGDKGEIVVSGGVWSIDTNAVSLGNMADNSITEAEIVDDTVIEADLFISNSPTLGYALTSNGSTGFTWTNPSSFIADGSILEAKLNIDNAPTDNYILAYNQPSLNFKWIDPATLSGGSSLPVDDTTSLVQDPVDGTKEMRIDVGAVSTATVRTLTMPDADVDLGNLGASNLDLTANYTWTGTHNFPNLTELNGTLKVIGNVTTHFGGLILYQNNASTQTGFLGYSGNSVRMSNVTSAQVLQLLDAGGADFNGNFTSDAFIKDGATSDDVLLGDGTTTSLAAINTDDQTASDVNITDAAGNFLSTNVEDALNETVGFIDAKFDNTGGTIGGNINFQDTYKATGLANPTVGSDAVNLSYLQGKEGSGFVTEHPDSGQTGIRIGVGTEAEKAAATLLANDIWISTDGKKKYVYTVPITAQGDDIAVATSVTSFFTTRAITVTNVWASLSVAPTGSVATFDINEDGTTILSTKITIDATEKTSNTAATPPVISDTSIAAFAELTFDIDGVGSSTPGTTGTIYIEYTVDDE